ncbi:sigma-70 family RNA polymerase sigma factor [Mucilaginibacter gotjawali]|nr:sigma-70 family RNA polymerase sigma factor [Mucilaginibacter gotjawali]MBB3054306.1 RNA polymerase sigma-70 factor (ECF subfamily) [Mucilaginibacter gotjawali]
MHIEKGQITVTRVHTCDPAQWVNKYADYLYGYTLSRINDEELARDLVQETFLAALERVEKFEGRSSESTWLTAILKNKIIDVYRKKSSGLLKRQEARTEAQDLDDFFEAEDGHWKVQHQPQAFGLEACNPLLGKEFSHILKQCMQKLPSLWLSVFTMKHMDEETTETICSELKVTSSNYWVIIHRAKVSLRACLQKNWI